MHRAGEILPASILVSCVAVMPMMATMGHLTAVVTTMPAVGGMMSAVVAMTGMAGVLLMIGLAIFAGRGLVALFGGALTVGILRRGGLLGILAALAMSIGGLLPQGPSLFRVHVCEALAALARALLPIRGRLVGRLVRRGQSHFGYRLRWGS